MLSEDYRRIVSALADTERLMDEIDTYRTARGWPRSIYKLPTEPDIPPVGVTPMCGDTPKDVTSETSVSASLCHGPQ